MKAGWKTSEAHMTLIVVVGGFALTRLGLSEACKDEVLIKIAPFISAGIASFGYAVSRGISKLGSKKDR